MFRLFFIAALCITTLLAEEENKCTDRVINYTDGGGVRDVTCEGLVLKHGGDLTSNIESVKDMTYFNLWLNSATGDIDESSFPKLRGEITKFHFFKCNLNQFVLPEMPKLAEIEISESTIPKITADSLKNAPKLEELIFRSQVDLQSEPSPFKHLHNLKGLLVQDQNIPHFTKTWLVGLDNLERLALIDNGVETLDEDVFETSNKIKDLSLPEPKLTKIQPNTFKPLKNLDKLNLIGSNLEDFSLDLLSEQKELTSLGLPTKFFVKIGLGRMVEQLPKLKQIVIVEQDEGTEDILELRKVAAKLNIFVKGRMIYY